MTSGQFTSYPIDKIIIQRDERQRREIKDIDILADSIQRLGVIHPVVITRDGVLVAGERRTTAIRHLGWTHIPVQFVDELPPSALRAIELEENIKRVDIAWQDQVRAVEEYHELMRRENPEWTQNKTADAIGLSRQAVEKQLAVAREMKIDATLAEAPKYTVARGKVERKQQRQKGATLEALRAPARKVDHPLLNADFHEWRRTYDGPRFNFLHCDFPYGIGADGFNQGAAPAHGGYDDSPEVYWTLIRGLADFIRDGHVAPDAHMMFWYSQRYYRETVDALTEQGWRVDHFPLIWVKSDNAGILPDPKRGPRRIYETALHCTRGDRFILSSVSNAIGFPTVRDRHMSEKPEAMLRHFFRMYVDPSTVMLDPTAGSGSAFRAARQLNAGHMVGLERNAEFYQRAVEAYNAPT